MICLAFLYFLNNFQLSAISDEMNRLRTLKHKRREMRAGQVLNTVTCVTPTITGNPACVSCEFYSF